MLYAQEPGAVLLHAWICTGGGPTPKCYGLSLPRYPPSLRVDGLVLEVVDGLDESGALGPEEIEEGVIEATSLV